MRRKTPNNKLINQTIKNIIYQQQNSIDTANLSKYSETTFHNIRNTVLKQ